MAKKIIYQKNRVPLWLLLLFIPLFTVLTLVNASAFTLNVVGNDGQPVFGYRWILEEDLTFQPTPGTPNPNNLGINFHKSYMPVVGNGESVSPQTTVNVPDDKHYFVSVLPLNGYSIGGAKVPIGQGQVTVYVNPQPIPTAQITVFVFEDTHPINNAPDLPEESGLAGFSLLLEDAGGRYGISAGQQMMDAFGNMLGTTYERDAAGVALLDDDGAPIIASVGSGVITTDANGRAVIKNLAPGKYGVQALPPLGQGWVQTSTIEGKKVIDAWVKANEPAYFREFGPPGEHVFIGFVKPFIGGELLDGGGSTTVSGQITNLHLARPSATTTQYFFEGGPIGHTTPWIGLNNLAAGNGVGIYAQPSGEDGTFSINNVPPGLYQLVVWDSNLNIVFAFHGFEVTAADGLTKDLGKVSVNQWFTRLEQYVFYDGNENGYWDVSEPGFPEQGTNIRWRDGTVYQSFPTAFEGDAPYDEVFPFFNWLVAEVDFLRFKATGATITIDNGGQVYDNLGGLLYPAYDGVLAPQPQFCTESDVANSTIANAGADGLVGTADDVLCTLYSPIINPNTGDNLSRTETGPVLTQAFQGFLGQTSIIEWGKKEYAQGENGGVSGLVFYAITRAENDPEYAAAEPWEPGIPRVVVNLYADGDQDHAPMGNFPGLEDIDWNSNGLLEAPDGIIDDINNDNVITAADIIQTTETDSWDDSQPEGCPGDTDDPFYMGGKCYDGLRNYNQVRPGVFDGGYAFDSYVPGGLESLNAEVVGLPAGLYIVETIPPVGYKTLKSEDRNVDFGDPNIPGELLLPPVCVGDEYEVGTHLSLFPDEPAPLAGQILNMCDRKQVALNDRDNAAADFFMFTDVPIAGHAVGIILDDVANEFDPNAPAFGEKFAPPWLPVSIRDWTGKEISRVYSGEWGNYNALVPSTFTNFLPQPSGMSPNMLTLCMNSPGPILDTTEGSPSFGEMITDPFFNRQYSQFCYTFNFMPGSTTYLDTPVVPVAAFAGPGKSLLDCEFDDNTPKIHSVSGPHGGPYISDAAGVSRMLEIVSVGTGVEIPNPAFDPDLLGSPKTITRDYDFGTTPGTVKIGETELSINSWTLGSIIATVPVGTATGQLMVTRGDNDKSTVNGVTVTVGGSEPIHVAPGGSIQNAVDLAVPGDLILVSPGVYEEFVIMWKPVRLQGWGAGSTIINAVKAPSEKLLEWRVKLQNIVDPAVGGDASYLLPGQEINFGGLEPDTLFTEEGAGILVLAKNTDVLAEGGFVADPNARIDGFSITGADVGGGIMVNGHARYLEISNNIVFGNQGVFGGGIRAGHPTLTAEDDDGLNYVDAMNDTMNIHNNHINQNGGLNGAGGGLSLNTGSDNYQVTENYICGNFTMGEGAGLAHFGLNNNGLIKNNTIIYNQSFNQGTTVNGGGILIAGGPLEGLSPGAGSVTVDANLIQGNLAGAGDGGGIRLSRINGRDVDANPNNPDLWYKVGLYNNMLVNNVAGLAGGGLSLQDAANVEIVNNTIAHNDSTATAGEAFAPGSPTESTPQPAGVVARNHSVELLDVIGLSVPPQYGVDFANPTFVNNIIWQNRSFHWLMTDALSFGLAPDVTVAPAVYDDLGVLGTAVPSLLNPMTSILTNPIGYDASNIMADPMFIRGYFNGDRGQTLVIPETTTIILAAPAFDEGGNFIDVRFGPLSLWDANTGELLGDYHIESVSPAINAADEAVMAGILALSMDFDGNERPLGAGSEIGADETADPPPPVNVCQADLNSDGNVDTGDFAVFFADWGKTQCSDANPCAGDLNNDGNVDTADFGLFFAEWGRTDCLVN